MTISFWINAPESVRAFVKKKLLIKHMERGERKEWTNQLETLWDQILSKFDQKINSLLFIYLFLIQASDGGWNNNLSLFCWAIHCGGGWHLPISPEEGLNIIVLLSETPVGKQPVPAHFLL